MNDVENYIEENWIKCIRENQCDDGTLIGVPYPYTVPSAEAFNELYYWDTYFTNIGLLKSGHAMLAKHNTDNILYLVNKYGFMPNGNRTCFLAQSQPPFLSEMVRDVYEYYRDDVWLTGAYSALKKEYNFWMAKRNSQIGLNCYAPKLESDRIDDFAEIFIDRVGGKESLSKQKMADHAVAVCESGWDMNPRWDFEAYNYAPVDLNALLFGMENNMAYFADILGNEKDVELRRNRALNRAELMNRFMKDDDLLFLDYNCNTKKLSKVFSTASFYTLFVKAVSREQAAAAVKNLYRLEADYGIVTCEKGERDTVYQWDYPNGWACLQHIVIRGLVNYGYMEDAKRIAEKYTGLVESVFEQTGALWEKYNVVEGNVNVSNEYKMPTMLGWSAGVYIASKNFLNKEKGVIK